jgi:hypothetical protein
MQIEYDGITARAPDFLIVGAPRCGTSALHVYLSSHPRIFMPVQKEPMFFSCWGREPFKDFISPHPVLKWVTSQPAAYTALFEPATPDQILGEASTINMPRAASGAFTETRPGGSRSSFCCEILRIGHGPNT